MSGTKVLPGPEMDALVAERVMGWRWREYWCVSETRRGLFPPPGGSFDSHDQFGAYSTEQEDAMEVVTRLVLHHRFTVTLSQQPAGAYTCEIARDEWRGSVYGEATTLPAAICGAALEAIAEDERR